MVLSRTRQSPMKNLFMSKLKSCRDNMLLRAASSTLPCHEHRVLLHNSCTNICVLVHALMRRWRSISLCPYRSTTFPFAKLPHLLRRLHLFSLLPVRVSPLSCKLQLCSQPCHISVHSSRRELETLCNLFSRHRLIIMALHPHSSGLSPHLLRHLLVVKTSIEEFGCLVFPLSLEIASVI